MTPDYGDHAPSRKETWFVALKLLGEATDGLAKGLVFEKHVSGSQLREAAEQFAHLLTNGVTEEEVSRRARDFLVVAAGARLVEDQTLPTRAERILSYLLPPDRLHEALGDFEEGYHLMSARHGQAYAKRWYWFQVLKVVAGAALSAVRKIIVVWVGLGPA